MEFLRKHLGLIVRLVVCFGILGFLATKIDWTSFWQAVVNTNPFWLGLAVLAWGGTLCWTAWRWYLLVHVQGIRVSLLTVFQLTMVGQFFNAFMFGTTGGDVIKIFYATRAAPTKRSAAGMSVIVDRVLGLAVLVIIAVVFVFWHYDFLVGNERTLTMVWIVLSVAAGLGCGLVAVIFLPLLKKAAKKLPLVHKLPMQDRLGRVYEAFARYRNDPIVMTTATTLSVVNHFTIFVSCYLLTIAMGFDVPFWIFISFLPIIFLLIAIPLSFGGLGVREVLFAWFFGLLGVPEADAIAFSLIFFMITLFWSVVGGLFYLRYKTPEGIQIDDLAQSA
ncbi:MAG: lysylphosphatidylglycerol synthase transmembrane domain-containing protein [Verrucomicrobiota bacterium]